MLSAFWTPRHVPLSTDLEVGRARLPMNHLLRELKSWLSTTLMSLHRWTPLDEEKARKTVAQGTSAASTSKNCPATWCLLKV